MLQKGLHAKVCQRRAKEYRRELSLCHKLHIKLSAGSVQQFDFFQKLCLFLLTDFLHQRRIINGKNLFRAFLGSLQRVRKGHDLPFVTVIYTLELLS